MVLWLDSDVQGSSQVPRGGKLEQEQKGLCRFPVRFPVRLELRLIDPRGRVAPPGVAHARPPSDPCVGSKAEHAWVDIGFIAAAALLGPSWSSKRYLRYVNWPY